MMMRYCVVEGIFEAINHKKIGCYRYKNEYVNGIVSKYNELASHVDGMRGYLKNKCLIF